MTYKESYIYMAKKSPSIYPYRLEAGYRVAILCYSLSTLVHYLYTIIIIVNGLGIKLYPATQYLTLHSLLVIYQPKTCYQY